MSQEKLKTILMQKFEEQTKCIMGDVEVENSTKLNFPTPHPNGIFLFCTLSLEGIKQQVKLPFENILR